MFQQGTYVSSIVNEIPDCQSTKYFTNTSDRVGVRIEINSGSIVSSRNTF